MQIQIPTSKTLRFLMGWMIVAALLAIVHMYQANDQTAERVVANYLAGLVLRYILGAFWSEFPQVYVSAMIAAAVFVIAVMTRSPLSKSAAKYAFITVMFLSLFCIWVEPWLTLSGLVTFVLLLFLGLSTVVVDIVVSVGWLLLWAMTTEAINREL